LSGGLDARAASFRAARQLTPQDARLFELRSAIDDFGSRGQPARAALIDAVSLLPADGVLPALGAGPRDTGFNLTEGR
jgi:hypothetical protein